MKLFHLLSAQILAATPTLGQTASLITAVQRVSLVDRSKAIGLSTWRIGLIGTSHYHFDQVGQAADFPGAKLLIATERPSPVIEFA